MNTLMVLRKRAPIALRTQTINPRGLANRFAARAAQRYWWLRKAGEPLCNVNVPDIHATLFVPPQQVALETIVRNEAALARYYAARYAYRARLLTDNFQHLIAAPVDHIAGRLHRAPPTVAHAKFRAVSPARPETMKIAVNGTRQPVDLRTSKSVRLNGTSSVAKPH